MNPSPRRNSPQPGRVPRELSPARTSTLLRIGMSGPRRPVDELIERLEMHDGAGWLLAALAQGPLAGVGAPIEKLVDGRASLDELSAIKQRSKDMLSDVGDRETRLAGLAGYFLTLAAALRHHGRLLTSRSRAELNETMFDLAAAAPEPFSRLLSEAALAGEH